MKSKPVCYLPGYLALKQLITVLLDTIYFHNQKVSRIYSENQKYQFIHQNRYCPLQSTLIDCNALMPGLDPTHETFFIFGFRLNF